MNSLLLILALFSSIIRADVLGYFPRLANIKTNYVISSYSSEEMQKEVEAFIINISRDGYTCNDHYRGDFSKLDSRRSRNLITAKELASFIVEVSDEFAIEAGILAALIYKESQFCNFGGTIYEKGVPTNKARMSETGAVGLTQFTSVAMREINDQLFSSDTGLFSTIIRPQFHRNLYNLGMASIYPLEREDKQYYRKGLWKKDRKLQANPKTKDSLGSPSNWKAQIAYGALYLKVLLASVRSDKKSFNETPARYYQIAVENYNGADLNQRTKYWNFIFSAYNSQFNSVWKEISNEEGIKFTSKIWSQIENIL